MAIIETTGGQYGKCSLQVRLQQRPKLSDEDIKRIVKQISNVDDVIIHLDTQSSETPQGVDTGGGREIKEL